MPFEYIEQFKRMERWYKRIDVVNNKVPKDMGDPEDEDDFLAFFQNCFHLKDWIINNKRFDFSKEEVEEFINKSNSLKICGDLCIGAKHLTIKNPRKDPDTKINRTYFVGRDISGPILRRDFIVTSEGKKYDALILAKKCIEDWENFFSNKGISWL